MNMVDETGGAMVMQEGMMGITNLNSSDPPDDGEDESEGGGSSSEFDGSVTNLKDRAAKETKRTLARNETRAGTYLRTLLG
jgi:hypothetical protein